MSDFSNQVIAEATERSMRENLSTLWPLMMMLYLPQLAGEVLGRFYPTSIAINYGLNVMGIAAAGLGALLVLDGTRRAEMGERISIAKLLALDPRMWGRGLALSLLVFIAICFGSALLVIPGLIIAMMWCVALPSMLEENLGVFAALGRSRELTRGRRMEIFFMYWAQSWMVAIPIVLIQVIWFSASKVLGMDPITMSQPVPHMLYHVGVAPFVVYLTVHLRSLDWHTYQHLRAIEEQRFRAHRMY